MSNKRQYSQNNIKYKRINSFSLNKEYISKVKCNDCSQLVEINKIPEHIIQHSDKYKFFKQSQPPINMQANNILMYVNHNYNYLQSIDVKTFNPKQLPKNDYKYNIKDHLRSSIASNKTQKSKYFPPSIQVIKSQPKSNLILTHDNFQQVHLNPSKFKMNITKRPFSCFKNKDICLQNTFYQKMRASDRTLQSDNKTISNSRTYNQQKLHSPRRQSQCFFTKIFNSKFL